MPNEPKRPDFHRLTPQQYALLAHAGSDVFALRYDPLELVQQLDLARALRDRAQQLVEELESLVAASSQTTGGQP